MTPIIDWWFDEQAKWLLFYWFWPHVIMGSADEWQKLGITMNGVKPIKC